jgi:hemerythrin superfamily protein
MASKTSSGSRSSRSKASSGRRGSSQGRASPRGSQSRASSRGRSAGNDAISLLKEDHGRVKALFERFEKARGEEQKSQLAETICMELTVHAQIEEEIFYPAAREAIDDEDLLDEAKVEHDSAKELIAQIQASSPEDELFDAKVKVLGEYVNHHVQEEERELFPEVRSSELDLAELGTRLRERKQELQAREGSGAMRRQPRGDAAGATP